MVEDHEMEFERGHEDENRDYDQAEDACPPMSGLFVLNQRMNMMKPGRVENVPMSVSYRQIFPIGLR